MRPPVDGPAHRRGLLLGQYGEQLVPAPVRAVDERLGEAVRGAPPMCVQQCLRGRRHGGVGRRAQRTVVVEPPGELRLYGGRVGGEETRDHVEAAGPVVGGRVGDDEAS
ncbi:hypothetical protein SGFS_038380 [Streptomyces graminofaciens]|uniref:Uncharacterized protein n=1 Tax=Streptomyces graminofaciens TaxID=68212 RepID=A0ABM7F973_9ACTN|nr:hypothetical protein SGFS_038380 [Streptomyces graminofaciens]